MSKKLFSILMIATSAILLAALVLQVIDMRTLFVF